MDTTIIAAIIGLVGVVLGVLLQLFLPNWIAVYRSRDVVIPDVIGKWKGEWYVEKDGKQSLYTEDIVYIEKRKGFQVFGKAKDIKGTYLIRGRFSMSNIFTLSYRFPDSKISLTGVVLLELDPLGQVFEGRWWGYTKEGGIMGGEVRWHRILEP